MPGARLEYWLEFGSTYSHVSSQRIGELARGAGVELVWRPFLLGPIFKSQGWDDSPFNLYAAKGRYMWRDMERLCEKYAVPFRRPSVFPRNGLLAARTALACAREPWCEAFVRGVFLANFSEDSDIASEDVIRAVVEESSGEEADAVIERANSPENKDLLRAQTRRAAELGIFGAPTFLAGDELFWGNDRLEDALAWLARGR